MDLLKNYAMEANAAAKVRNRLYFPTFFTSYFLINLLTHSLTDLLPLLSYLITLDLIYQWIIDEQIGWNSSKEQGWGD